VSPGTSALGELEPIYAVSSDKSGLTVRVSSNGCTVKEDFTFFVERRGGEVSVAFGRKRLDRCQSLAIGKAELNFSYAELGIGPRASVFVLNPLVGF
jgi:hypothetical protein